MLERFRQAYADPEAEVERAIAAGRRPIRTLGFDAPRTALMAAGFQPIRLVAPPLAATPSADEIMGAAAMRQRGKRLLEALLEPARPEVPVLITAADDEQPQIFAALRELARLGEAVPQHVHFFDRLHIRRPASNAYTAKRMAQLEDWLRAFGPDPHAQIELADQTELLAKLADLRAAGRVSGTDALQVIGAAAIMPLHEHGAALTDALRGLADAPILPGQRVFVCGTPHESAELYRAIEAAGALIVGEDHAWGAPFMHSERQPSRVASPAQLGMRIAEQAAALDVDLVLHLTIGGDEAAPWDVAAIKRALTGRRLAALRCAAEQDARFAEELRVALSGQSATAPPATSAGPRPATARPASDGRSRKSLTSVADFNAYQREWFAEVRRQVAAGAPFAVVNANAPQEILRTLGIPFVVNQWWASIVAAKQQTRRYLGLLRERDYPPDVEAYSAQGLAAAFDDDPELAPWGGLPRPDFLHAVASSDATLKMFEMWAQETGADCYVYERSYDPRPDLFQDWWDRVPGNWDEALEAERIDLMVAELREVIGRLERKTGRTFSHERFAEIMDLVNEQEDYYRRTRELVARTVPCPIGVADQMPATMVPQWHRGTEWARDAAKAFYEEVKARVDAGLAAVPNERVRLMWVGRGLWSEMGFYQKWEESHGAVFVWSMYLALAADGYIREFSGGRDPLRALASRFITMGDELRMPTWAGPWHVHEAETHQVDAAIALQDADPFVVRALRAAGYPVLELTADNFNRESEDGAAIEAAITAFIQGPASARAMARREAAHVSA
jgi:benzoyl-CoA reductase/2-hydroxyglutaryl-CoA dehydratase subunit BcrC/BadD/HgdB